MILSTAHVNDVTKITRTRGTMNRIDIGRGVVTIMHIYFASQCMLHTMKMAKNAA